MAAIQPRWQFPDLTHSRTAPWLLLYFHQPWPESWPLPSPYNIRQHYDFPV
ncbi:hypothetical protein LguiB_020783 [Lonicera macranthoides]